MVSTRQSSGQGEGASTSGWVTSSLRLSRSNQESIDVATESQRLFLLDLPHEVLEKILSYLKFKNISQLRMVCRRFDLLCSQVLNSQFHKLQNQMLVRFQCIKSRMPRRESARRNHPLACESDIVETLHMRLTLLHMTFGKHIERRNCCFFPGEILDEVKKILVYIASTPKLARPYKVTDELFDLSTMAMEYFKEKIEPTLPEIYFGTDYAEIRACTTKYVCMDFAKGDDSPVDITAPPPPPPPPPLPLYQTPVAAALNRTTVALRKRISRLRLTLQRVHNQLGATKREVRILKSQSADQSAQLAECKTRMEENEKKNEEMARKFGTVLQELNKCKTEFQYWRSKSPATPLLCSSCGVTGVQQQPNSEELRGLLGNDFVPIAGPSQEGGQDCVPVEEPVEETASAEPEAPAVEPPRAKRKRDAGSRDSTDSRKPVRGSLKGRKKLKM